MPISDHFAGSSDVGFANEVAERVAAVRGRIADAMRRSGRTDEVTLVAVTKTHGPEAVAAAWQAGVTDVGENRVQEAESKMVATSAIPVRWHLIGHLQRNKARAATRFALVHSVDSDRIAAALDAAAGEAGITLDVLVQANVSGEESKGGVSPADVPAFADRLHLLRNLRVRGAMTMAPFDAPESTLRAVFSGARDVREALRECGHPATVLSMGMSGDYEIAVEEGATHVRLGTTLFGSRSQSERGRSEA